MKKPIVTAVIIAAALTLAGCSSGTPSHTQAAAKPTAKTASATPTLPPVSLETTCQFLYGSHMDGPVNKAADIITRFVAAPDGSTITATEIQTVVDEIETADEHASSDLKPYIEAQLPPLKILHSALTGGGNQTINFDDFKASGIELVNRCRPYLH